MHFAYALFVVALLVSLLTNALRNLQVLPKTSAWSSAARHSVAPAAGRVKLLAYVPSGDAEWPTLVWSAFFRAHDPRNVQICLLAECRDAADVDRVSKRKLLPEIRHVVHVEHTTAAASRGRWGVEYGRLLRRFLLGDETVVCVAHTHCRLLEGWERALIDAVPRDAILSAPTAADTGVGRFPSLRRRSSNGHVARGTSRPFALPPADGGAAVVPSVCWCPEFAAAWPSTWRRQRWPGRSASLVAETDGSAAPHVVPTFPLLEPDRDRVEDLVIDVDEGCPAHALCAKERAGLTPRAGVDEKIAKYGSSLLARIAARQFS